MYSCVSFRNHAHSISDFKTDRVKHSSGKICTFGLSLLIESIRLHKAQRFTGKAVRLWGIIGVYE